MRLTENGNYAGERAALPQADAVQTEPLIMISEEQLAIRELLCWMLHLAGYRMLMSVERQATLTWGEQTMIPADLPTVLLLDLSSLCAQEAADFLGRVRARWQVCFTVPLQIIVLTTHPNVQAYLRSRECVLLKPFHVRDLLALIRQRWKPSLYQRADWDERYRCRHSVSAGHTSSTEGFPATERM